MHGDEGQAVAMTQQWSPLVAQLRHRRREIRKELARIRWWLRLLAARKDLDIARLSPPGETGAVDLDSAWEALAADAPTSGELAACLWADTAEPVASSIERIDVLIARLASYEARVSENLETVTTAMVQAMGAERVPGTRSDRMTHA